MRELDQPDSTVVLPDRCPALNDDDFCDIYEDCPTICKNWPVGPNGLIPGCGYYFLEFGGDMEDELVAIHKPGKRRRAL